MRTKKLHFRVHTPNLLHEVVDNGLRPGMGVLRIPLDTLRRLLAQVAQRCTEINDPVLNRLMFDLTLYELPSPSSKKYGEILKAVYKAEREYLKRTKVGQSPGTVSTVC
jgi:hypothetical protein